MVVVSYVLKDYDLLVGWSSKRTNSLMLIVGIVGLGMLAAGHMLAIYGIIVIVKLFN